MENFFCVQTLKEIHFYDFLAWPWSINCYYLNQKPIGWDHKIIILHFSLACDKHAYKMRKYTPIGDFSNDFDGERTISFSASSGWRKTVKHHGRLISHVKMMKLITNDPLSFARRFISRLKPLWGFVNIFFVVDISEHADCKFSWYFKKKNSVFFVKWISGNPRALLWEYLSEKMGRNSSRYLFLLQT